MRYRVYHAKGSRHSCCVAIELVALCRLAVLFLIAIAFMTIIISKYMLPTAFFVKSLNDLTSILRVAKPSRDFSTPLLFRVLERLRRIKLGE